MGTQQMIHAAVLQAIGQTPYNDLLHQVAAGEISLDVDPVPLEKIEQAWTQAGSDRRTVFVP